MRPLETWMLTYVVNAAWQTVLIVFAALLAVRLAGRRWPRLQHRVWSSSVVLAAVLPACDLRLRGMWSAVAALLHWSQGVGGTGQVSVYSGPGLVLRGADALPAWLAPAAALGVALTVAVLAGRLLLGLWQTRALLRGAVVLERGDETHGLWARCCAEAGVRPASCVLAVSERVAVPVTVGLLGGAVLLPPALLRCGSAEDWRAVFLHELMHVRRHDFLRNLLYQLVALPIAWHPLVPVMKARFAESREQLCDGLAADLIEDRGRYARSLLRLATLLVPADRPARSHAIGMFDRHSFERRIVMLTSNFPSTTASRRIAGVLLCGLLTVAACGTALAFHVRVGEAHAAAPSTPNKAAPVPVQGAVMAGNKLSGDDPVYPPDAKKAKVQGTVTLKAVISKTGEVEHLQVVSGPKALVSSAVDAVRTWKYQPYLLNGDATEVETTIRVNYMLQP